MTFNHTRLLKEDNDMKYVTILFTTASFTTAGIVVASRKDNETWHIDRHASESNDYTHAYILRGNGFQPCGYAASGGLEVNTVLESLFREDTE